MKVKALAVKGYGPFVEKSVFNFKPGLSVIYGLNQTGGKYSKNSNWVGKSLFFNSLSELLYDEPIVGLKQDKVKAGTRAVILTDDEGRDIQIVKTSGKRETIKIIEDGKEIEHLTKTKALDYIRSKWVLSKSEFETFVHLDSRVPHPLVMGSSTDRKHFFDQFFHLDRIDYERKIYLSALNQLKGDRTAFNDLRTSYRSQKAHLITKDEYHELRDKVATLKEQQAKKQKDFELVQRYKELETVYKTLEAKVKGVDLEQIDNLIISKERECKKLGEQIADYADYKAYVGLKKVYEQRLSELSDLARDTDLKRLEKGHRLYLKARSELRSVQEQEEELTEVRKPIKPEQRVEQDLVTLMAERKKISEYVDLAIKFKKGVCPTCGQNVKVKNIDELNSKLDYLDTQIELAESWSSFDRKRDLYLAYKKRVAELELERQELEKKVKKFKPYSEAYEQKRDLPQPPDKVEKPKYDIDELKEEEKVCRQLLSTYTVLKPHVDQLREYLDWDTVTEFDYTEFNKTNEEIARIETLIQLNLETRKSLKSTTARLRELQSSLEAEIPLKSLVDIFSDKQLKRLMVQQISQKLCGLLNKYASFVFNQDYKFELIWDTQLQLICTRKVGQQSLTSDVRKLSGAESKLFTIILVLSLMSFVPTDRRPSVILMDEPTANLSAETTQSFMKLIDVLKTVFESIVIITPRDDVYPESHCYTVVRTKKGSTIREGLPEECV